MEIATYVIYELLIRLQELNPGVGEYVSSKKSASGVLLKTSTGTIDIPEDLLHRQFHQPALVSQAEMLSMLEHFKLSA